MDNTKTAALLGRAARFTRQAGAFWGDYGDLKGRAQSVKVADALEALAAELAATPPAPPWLPAPDGPGEWDAGAPGQDAVTLDTYRSAATLWATLPSGATVEVARWIADHPTWRYRRRPTVIVPAEEPAP